MSVHISSLVWKLPVKDASTKLVLLKLADNSNDDGESWPSLTTISQETGLARSTVCEKLKSLEKSGWLKRKDGVKPSTFYRLTLPSPVAGLVRQSDYASPVAGLGESASRTSASPPAGHEPSVEPSNEPSMNHQSCSKFKKPTVESVKLQCRKIGLPESEAEHFWNHHEARGWKLGRNLMVSWTAALQTWKKNFNLWGNKEKSIFETFKL